MSAGWFGDEGYVDDHFKVGSFLSIEVRHFLMKSFLANLILFQTLFWYIFLNIRQRASGRGNSCGGAAGTLDELRP